MWDLMPECSSLCCPDFVFLCCVLHTHDNNVHILFLFWADYSPEHHAGIVSISFLLWSGCHSVKPGAIFPRLPSLVHYTHPAESLHRLCAPSDCDFSLLNHHGQAPVQDFWQQGNAHPHAWSGCCWQNQYPLLPHVGSSYVHAVIFVHMTRSMHFVNPKEFVHVNFIGLLTYWGSGADTWFVLRQLHVCVCAVVTKFSVCSMNSLMICWAFFRF